MKKIWAVLALIVGLLASGPPVQAEIGIFTTKTLHSAATVDGDGAFHVVEGFSTVTLTVTIASTATVSFKVAQNDPATYSLRGCTDVADITGALVTTTDVSGTFTCSVAGMKYFSAPISGCSGCTVTVSSTATTAISSRGGGGGGGASTLDAAFDGGKIVDGANSLVNAACFGDTIRQVCLYGDATTGPTIRGQVSGADVDSSWRCWTSLSCIIYDVANSAPILTITPGAANVNLKYQFGTNYKPVLSVMLPLIPRGAASEGVESIVSNQPKANYITITDANTDAVDFSFNVTSKMVGATTATFRLIGVSKNAAPSGNIELDCAMSEYTPGTNTFAAHVTTGEVAALLTPATQNRPVAVTTAAHTINGTLAAGDIVFGSCEVDATATTSAQLTDFRLYGYVLMQLSVNSWSD